MRYRWRGPQPRKGEEQVANAPDDSFDFSPASSTPAEQTENNWAAVMPHQDVPLTWERRHG